MGNEPVGLNSVTVNVVMTIQEILTIVVFSIVCICVLAGSKKAMASRSIAVLLEKSEKGCRKIIEK